MIDGITSEGSGKVQVKVGAVDASGVERVVLSYIRDINRSVNELQSFDLTYDGAKHKWIGTFDGDTNSRFLAQVVDKAGNITTAVNKGQYYRPGQVKALEPGNRVFLPLVLR